jgi:hypothetical protein
METKEIMNAIKKLPVTKRMLIVEHTLKTIREGDTWEQMAKAVDVLYKEYQEDKDLTAFMALDYEAFYETR